MVLIHRDPDTKLLSVTQDRKSHTREKEHTKPQGAFKPRRKRAMGEQLNGPRITCYTYSLAAFRKADLRHHFMVAWPHNSVNGFLTDGQLGCFQFLTIVSKAAMNIPAQVLLRSA